MAQPESPTCRSLEDKTIHICVDYDKDQAQGESEIMNVRGVFHSPYQMCGESKNVCIYRVLEFIKISKPEAYEPMVVSLGPYRHNINLELSGMDRHKLEAVHRMLARLKTDVKTLIAEIQKLECKIRECYEEPIVLDGETLAWMTAMDSCFILEFFRVEDCFSSVFQRADRKNSMYYAILDDILKLENQIPFFILIKMLELECGSLEHAKAKLAEMLGKHRMFSGFPFSCDSHVAKSKLMEHMMSERLPSHLLDLYRRVIKSLLTNSSAESTTPVERDGYDRAHNYGWSMTLALRGWMQRLSCNDKLPCPSTAISPECSRVTPPAAVLHKAGINFQPGQLRFQKRRFGASTLSLPQIIISASTETMLRNLIAYEECQSSEGTVISHFVILLKDLIESAKDVSVLRKSLVVQSLLGKNEEIARMFNRLGVGVSVSRNEQIENVMIEAKRHFNSRCKVRSRIF